jgi:hypothetical protein
VSLLEKAFSPGLILLQLHTELRILFELTSVFRVYYSFSSFRTDSYSSTTNGARTSQRVSRCVDRELNRATGGLQRVQHARRAQICKTGCVRD